MVVGLWGSSFKNAFHTLSYRFAAVILVILYSRGKGKELKDAEQGCIADTLTEEGRGRVFCVCFMKVRFVARRREEEVGFDGLCCCKLLTQSDLYKNY